MWQRHKGAKELAFRRRRVEEGNHRELHLVEKLLVLSDVEQISLEHESQEIQHVLL
jgi:hypothetical protein